MPKIDPATGATIDSLQFRIPVPGTSEYIYQADAYGALQLLSRERPGTPICGVRVWAGDDGQGGRVHIERNNPEVIPGPSYVTSVAQGGRLLTAGPEYYRLTNGNLSLVSTDPTAYEIFFTERDTIYTRAAISVNGNAYRYDMWVRVGSHYSGRDRQEDMITRDFRSGTWGGGFQEQATSRFSPNSDWLFLRWDWADSEYECPEGGGGLVPYGGGTYLIPLGSSLSMQTFSTYSGNYCNTSPPIAIGAPLDHVGWRNTGQEFVAASLGDGQGTPTRLQRYTVGTAAQATGPSAIAGDAISGISWLPEGGRVEVRESDVTACLDVIRSTATLESLESRACTAWQPTVPLLRSPAVALSGMTGSRATLPRLAAPGTQRARPRDRTPIRYN